MGGDPWMLVAGIICFIGIPVASMVFRPSGKPKPPRARR